MLCNSIRTLFVATLLSAAALSQGQEPASNDEILLDNGSRILGVVTGLRDGKLRVDTDFAGTLAIPLDQVASLRTGNPVVMQMADDSIIEGQPLVIEDQRLVVSQDRSLALDQLLAVNPEPWEMGRGYAWSGLANFAFSVQRGNSDTDELDYRLETSWRSDDDRYTLKLNGELDEANDTKNAENWTVIGKYDYFFDGPSYWGVNGYLESDAFADLDLRYYLGPYIGRELYTSPVLSLSAEAGLSYVNEDFISAEDQDYPGANWTLHLTSDLLGGESRLYLDQIGIWNLERTDELIVNTSFGLAFPLLFGLEAAAEVLLEYDSGAVEGVRELDETYAFRLGYTW